MPIADAARISAGDSAPLPRSRSGLDSRELDALIRGNTVLFQGLADASILLTGATGWFGVWLLDALCFADDALRLGLRITAISRDPGRFLGRLEDFRGDPRISWITADVRCWEPASGAFTHIIHGAADTVTQATAEASSRLFETIVEGTRRVVGAAGAGCRSVLLLSSGAVYGPALPDCARFVEGDCAPPEPSGIRAGYAEGKRAAERIGAIAAAGGAPIRIARCFAFVGPHMPFDRHFAIGNFIADAVRGRPIRVKSDGRPQRSYLYMTDLVRALLTIMARGAPGRPYNVGSDAALSVEQLAHCVQRVAGGGGVIIEGAPSDPGDRYVPSTARIQQELGFVAEVPLETAIARTAAWYRARIDGSMST